MKNLLTYLVGAVAIGAGVYLYRKRGGMFGKSAAEEKVDALYGPSQAWKTNPVYNTPGLPGYIPTLPPSYAPGTAPMYASYIGPPPPLPVGGSATAVEPFMFGLGQFRLTRSPVAPRLRAKPLPARRDTLAHRSQNLMRKG